MHGLQGVRRPARAGEDIDYDGVSGPIELGETGSPTAASIGIYEYDAKNKIAPGRVHRGPDLIPARISTHAA